MVTRKKIGLIYQYNENWIGGTYYIQNLVSAVNLLPDEKKPEFVVFAQPDHFEKLKQASHYLYLSRRDYKTISPFLKKVNRISKKLIKKKIIIDYYSDLDLVFPADRQYGFKPGQKFLYWIPDFQEHYLPKFFTNEETVNRKKYQKFLVEKASYIVFSSQSAKADFNEIYPQNSVTQFVLPFAVTHIAATNDSSIHKKYKIPNEYFICSNQFWKHKNHIVVLEAVASLKNENKEVFVAFTGKEHDYRNPDYYESLKQRIAELGIENNIAFLGFIDREDQISLMQNSLAVIQPSLFEGWSTVVEDAKAVKANIIVSDIKVHKEQLVDYPSKQFFSPYHANDLANCLTKAKKQTIMYDYEKQIADFGSGFYTIFQTILQP